MTRLCVKTTIHHLRPRSQFELCVVLFYFPLLTCRSRSSQPGQALLDLTLVTLLTWPQYLCCDNALFSTGVHKSHSSFVTRELLGEAIHCLFHLINFIDLTWWEGWAKMEFYLIVAYQADGCLLDVRKVILSSKKASFAVEFWFFFLGSNKFHEQQKLTCYNLDHNVFECRPHLIIIDNCF